MRRDVGEFGTCAAYGSHDGCSVSVIGFGDPQVVDIDSLRSMQHSRGSLSERSRVAAREFGLSCGTKPESFLRASPLSNVSLRAPNDTAGKLQAGSRAKATRRVACSD